MSFACDASRARAALGLACALSAPSLPAHEGAHVHGLVRLDVAVDAEALTVQLEAPLDSLIGFEHPPRTVAQRRAADALLAKLQDVQTLISPNLEAQRTVAKSTAESNALKPGLETDAVRETGQTPDEEEHADLDASFEFSCGHVERLDTIEIGLFDVFERIQRVEVQVATGMGQFKRTLTRPAKLLRIAR